MWNYNNDKGKWVNIVDELKKSDFNYLREELKSTRYYSKCLSGATYLPMNTPDNIYDILNEYEPKTWYINGSQYSESIIPSTVSNLKPINRDDSYEYYTKYNTEYGLTLKNMFSPNRLIKDSIKNFLYVDIATTELIDINLSFINLIIDGVVVKSGHRVLVKNQLSNETLSIDIDPYTYFKGDFKIVQDYGATIEYVYSNNQNGIYLYNNNRLVRTNELDDYKDCIRYSIVVKLGNINSQKQFHLNRLLDGYYPTTQLDEPIEFTEKHNWMIRNRVDYNNLFEINYYDIIKNPTHSYTIDTITYSIPERTLSVGEFGVILNLQYGISNIIPNKYKVNLRSITTTDINYWICGDSGTLLKVRKHDFSIERVGLDTNNNLKSISFFNNLRGVVVGEFNTIFITDDGGLNWNKIIVEDFNSFIYNKVLYQSLSKIFIAGNTGVFLELEEDLSGWSVYKRRISRFIDDYEEQVLVDNINDILITSFDSTLSWGLSFSSHTQSTNINKELIFMVTDDSKIIVQDINESIPHFDFLFLDFDKEYGNITNITRGGNSSLFYFTTENSGINIFDILMFQYIGNNSYSNTIKCNDIAINSSEYFINSIYCYNDDILLCGNDSLLKISNHDSLLFSDIDNSLNDRLKSKMLFLDYDIASKLNFFKDNGEYRLPNNAVFNLVNNFDDSRYPSGNLNHALYSYINRSNLNSYISTIYVDGISNKPKNISIKVNLDQNVNSLTINLISPDGRILNLKRSGNGIGNTLLNTTFTSDMLKQNMSFSTPPYSGTYSIDNMIGRGYSPYVSNTNSLYDMSVDDINGYWSIYLNWGSRRVIDILDDISAFRAAPIGYDDIIIAPTQTGTFSNWEIFFENGVTNEIDIENIDISKLWFEPIIHGATSPSYVTQSELSWLDYWKDTSKTFEYYTSYDDTNSVIISTTFSCRRNNKFDILPSGITSSITSIEKLAPSLLDNSNSDIISGITNIIAPQNNSELFLYKNLLVIRIPSGFNVIKGDVIRFVSSNIDTNLIVNKIVNLVDKFIYLYNTFNSNMINDIISNSDTISITNLNSYTDKSELEYNFNIHPISNAYKLSFTDINMNIEPIFNNLTSYYNLATNVLVYDGNSTIKSNMLYDEKFLDFGYTPTFNILNYLESINDSNTNLPKFYADKEYFSMPRYIGLPMASNLSFSSNQVYIDYNGILHNNTSTCSNRIYFGIDIKYEWESIFINTFVDIVIHASDGDHSTTRLLVMNKFKQDDLFIIEFHKAINYTIGIQQQNIDIISRRTLLEISNDLQELNNIQRGRFKEKVLNYNMSFNNDERDVNFKISTDSYAKILLSDSDTINELSAIIYTDNKNELSMNITKLDREYVIPILTTSYYDSGSGPKVLISCKIKHGLKTHDGVVLEFNGGIYSSKYKNQEYFGYHNVHVVDQFNFYIDTIYGEATIDDIGYVRFIKRDPFLNYQPIDLIDIGVDLKAKNSILLLQDNVKLKLNTYSLNNVDYNRFRFRLVDGLTIERIIDKYSWILEAEIEDAIIGEDPNGIVWYKGTWECGRWFGGTWVSGTWINGDWYGGTWNSKKIKDNLISIDVDNKSTSNTHSTWFNGRWYDGIWDNGQWLDGRWYGGVWNNGNWNKGIWNDGKWINGVFSGGIWIQGTWLNGIFNCDINPSFWLNGKWKGGDFENGIWYNGTFEQLEIESKFGTKAYNSRTANWCGGQWLNGSFFSSEDGTKVSKSHIYSIWKSGNWYGGNWYGGIAYNIDFKSGTWHGGILEDIQIIGIQSDHLLLNGIFRFNIGDEITILGDEQASYQDIGKHDKATIFKVIKVEIDDLNKITKLHININNEILRDAHINSVTDTNFKDKLRVVSRFRNSNWKSGIWSNGYYESGVWSGGIFYNGLFEAKWF